MNQQKHSPTLINGTPVEVSALVEGLIIGLGLRQFATASRDGLRLCIGSAPTPGHIFSLEIGRKEGSSYIPVANLSYRLGSGTYCLAASQLPRQLRSLRGLLSHGSPANISYDQALFAAYELLTYLKIYG
jgi:hypothetical protein